ncbi:VanZ family protein [Actinomadura harenae]|uniref:VanZ family protein n=1 Tax=Actinomadura harenae TaxID=2483351 RepID=A0A3M2M402_9ACTN|nr:VanZ family protein [Actinomadura harenae]RMI43820.1 VanZ family protein [Actinomadura harenae]
MPHLPHHVPIEVVRALTLWTVLALGAACAWRPLVRRNGWAPLPTLALLMWTSLILAMTVPMTFEPGVGDRLSLCMSHPVAHAAWSVRTFGDRGLEDVMNVALWAPSGALSVVATRRSVLAPTSLSLTFVLVEFLQTLDPGRECDPGDMVYNSTGLAIGAIGAVVALRVVRAVRVPR